MGERPQDKIIERIRKILARTQESGCTSAEAEAAFAKASALLAEHNLTMEECKEIQPGQEDSWIEEEVHETGRWGLEDNLCYHILKEFFFVEGFFSRRDGRKVFTLFGKSENVAVARFTWNALRAAFDRCWIMYRYLNKKPASERRLYITGMANGFSHKLREERKAQEMERDVMKGRSGGTALAIASIKDKTLAKYKETHPDLKASRGSYSNAVGDRSTLQAGYEAGKALNLNRAIGGRGRKGLAS